MKAFALLLAGAVSVGFASFQATVPQALATHFDKLSAAKTIHVVYTGRVIGDVPAEYELSMAKPNLFKLLGPEGFVLSDGKSLYTYTKSSNSYSQEELTDDALQEFAHRPEVYGWAGFLLQKPAEDITGAKAGESRSMQGNKVNEMNVTLKDDKAATFYLDPKLGIARGFSYRTDGKEYLEVAKTIELGSEPAAEDAYVWTAPAGAKKVEPAKAAASDYASVQKILTDNCMPCHNATNKKSGVNLSSYEGVRATVTPGNPGGSRLIRSVRTGGMPKGRSPLPEATIKTIEAWIKDGAKK